MNNSQLVLEPRLEEYMKMRKMHKENGIKPKIPLEEQYKVTKNDVKTIRQFYNANRSVKRAIQHEEWLETRIRNRYNPGKFKDIVDISQGTFPSETMKHDARLDKIKVKQQKDIDANRERHNLSNLNFDGFMVNSREQHYENANYLDSEQNKSKLIYDTPSGYIDHKSITAINKSKVERTPLNSSMKISEHVLDSHRDDCHNIDVDSYLQFGSGTLRASKSLGYPNSFENQFSYIDEDIQNPDHVVNTRGVSTRHYNHSMANRTDSRAYH